MSCPLLKCFQTCMSPYAPEGRPECLTVQKSVFLGIAIGEAVGVASSVIHGTGWCVSWGPFQMAPLASSFHSLGWSRSIWAELEGLLAREIVFIQCIHNQAPYLSIHLSLSLSLSHTHITGKQFCSEADAHYTLTYTNTILCTNLLHTAGNTHTQSFTFCSLSVYTPAAWSHTFGDTTYIMHAHINTQTLVKPLQSV